jgi:hypothetical protein
MNAERLLKLAEHLETGKLGHEQFDFGHYNVDLDLNAAGPKCGAFGCAIGECPILFPDDWKFDGCGLPSLRIGSVYASSDARSFFDIDISECDHLFYPDSQVPDLHGGVNLGICATKEEVAANIRSFVALKKGAGGTLINVPRGRHHHRKP